jgi:hypothetical protein
MSSIVTSAALIGIAIGAWFALSRAGKRRLEDETHAEWEERQW